MNTNITISLDTRREKKDGTFPLVMRLGHNERTTSIPTDICLHKKDWDEEDRLIKKSYKGTESVTWLNNSIQKRKSDAMDIILKLNEAGQLAALSVTELRDKLKNNGSKPSFFAYGEGLVKELNTSNRIGTARYYKGTMDVLKTFAQGKDLSFEDITYSFLSKFETQHLSKGNSPNGLAVYLRAIRSLYNKAMKSGLVEKQLYPFDDYKIKTVPTEKRALDWDYLKKIIELEIPPTHLCFNARNYFVASYMMYGMNFMDMAYLKKDDIKNGRVQYRRKKTSKLYDIKLSENLEKILSHYMSLSPDSEYVFPIIKRETPLHQSKDIQWARKRYNSKLKLLAELCGIDGNLTSYVSRHSFATQAMRKDVPLNAISSMLGHSSLKTTEIYLKSLPSEMLDNYNEHILSGQ